MCIRDRSDGEGQNQLGRILTLVRADLTAGTEFERWVGSQFRLLDDPDDAPMISLQVYKRDEFIEKVELRDDKQSWYVVGRVSDCHLKLQHPSISRLHSLIVTDKALGPVVVDLGSSQGTFLNGKRLTPYLPVVLPGNATLTFGASLREHRVVLDRSNVMAKLQRRQAELEAELRQHEGKTEAELTAELENEIETQAKDSATLFVGNLGHDLTKDELHEEFDHVGGIEEIRMPMNKDMPGQNKGIAFVRFVSPAIARKAMLEMGNTKIGDRYLKLSIAKDEQPKRPDGKGGKGKGKGRTGRSRSPGRGKGRSPRRGSRSPGRRTRARSRSRSPPRRPRSRSPRGGDRGSPRPVSYTHLRAHETPEHLVCRLLLEKKKKHKAPHQRGCFDCANHN
eukprot:TRINITY_DN55608_c0_g1_i1.p1 TRINITY_DN55608_c0_g1~~TRINITY_DN55608_c0_g1_i1.p1  ORF type:complete len:394 (+),score=94.21 TRINITY_DN55608_c0_g1_i1:150-1331(+)